MCTEPKTNTVHGDIHPILPVAMVFSHIPVSLNAIIDISVLNITGTNRCSVVNNKRNNFYINYQNHAESCEIEEYCM